MGFVKDFWGERLYVDLLLDMQKRVHDYVVADKGTSQEALDQLVKDWKRSLPTRASRPTSVTSVSPAPCAGETRRNSSSIRVMAIQNQVEVIADRLAARAPQRLTLRSRGLSDRTVARLFIAPTMLLLLAINIFPLIWAIRLSLTNYKSNLGHLPIRFVGLANYLDILSDDDVWQGMQTTAHFVVISIAAQILFSFGLALLINRGFRGHGFWTTVILLPMMLSPAVVGNFWTLLLLPQIGPFNYVVGFLTGVSPRSFPVIGDVSLVPWTIVMVDSWMWTPYVMLICLAGLRSIPDYIYEAAEIDRASPWRQFLSITLPMMLPFLMLAILFRAIEAFKMFDLVNLLASGGPGSTTELASITLKREAFEKWRTGYSSAFAIIFFVTVFGAANVYVKALNRVKRR